MDDQTRTARHGQTNGEGQVAHQQLTEGDVVRVDAGGWGLTWAVRPDGQLAQIGLGPQGHLTNPEVPLPLYPLAYRTWGSGDTFREAALRVTHSDGTLTTRLRATQLTTTSLDGDEHFVVTCRDQAFEFTVEHHMVTHRDSGVLEQWVEIEHDEPDAVRLSDYDSICHFLVAAPDAQVIQFGGSGWADEWHWTTESLTPGIRSLASLGGIQPHLQRSPMLILSPQGPSTEASGATIGMSIAWGGNTRFHLDVRPKGGTDQPFEVLLKAGANPYGADYTLDPHTRFVTPTVAWAWSEGRDAMSEAFWRWTRARVLRDPDRDRAIVANNWEATFFDFDDKRIKGLIRTAAGLGAEVFLLDDGWFGSRFPRNNDDAGLGDWEINTTKLPGGLAELTDEARDAGIRFGIWVEPEMVNPQSALYETHPDWVIRDQREPLEHRWQLALDPLIDEVRDFEVGVIDQTMTSAPGTSYMKWDANRPITDPGSTALGRDRQANLFVDGVHATWDVMARVAASNPALEMMLCASGGGRNDHGTLRYFHEFWTSDNTDPLDRIRMQWACGHFFPASVMAAHVTRWGERPLGFACAVALSGRFGVDLDLDSLTDEELATIRSAVKIAKRIRHTVQTGKVHRLVSPVEGPDRSRAALAYGSRADACYDNSSHDDPQHDGPQVVVFRYQMEATTTPGPSIRLPALEAAQTYRVTRTLFGDSVDAQDPVEMTGAEIAEMVATWPLTDACSADLIEISSV